MAQRGKLTRDKIVAEAMKLLDKEGEKSFSMRKLAAALSVDPMALYHHHANRAALIADVLSSFLNRVDLPPPTENWQEDLRMLCNGLRTLAKAHPGTFRIYELYEDFIPAENKIYEAFYATLARAGFDRAQMVPAVRVLMAYTETFAVDEITGWLDSYDAEDRAELEDSLSDGEHPTMAALIDEIATVDADADFDFGLTILIRGLETQLPD